MLLFSNLLLYDLQFLVSSDYKFKAEIVKASDACNLIYLDISQVMRKTNINSSENTGMEICLFVRMVIY